MAFDTAVTIEFSLEFQTDPIGATLDVAVPDAPSDDARQALLDNIERSVVGAQGNLVFQAVQQAHETFESYGSAHDYHVESIIDSFDGVDASRSRTTIEVSWSWGHEAAKWMEFGTSDHTVNGDPLLVFEFSKREYPGLAELFPDGTAFLPAADVTGLPESRAVRDSLHWFRREVGQA
ncbi:hypothetical protein VB779_08675 [Haloarculaceae archaeon H-GB11]|nr:hypothetical protein [Haloarculaceae archaeon H-GB11]